MFIKWIPRQLKRLWTWPLIEILLLSGSAAVILVVLLGPVAILAAPTAELHGKDKADVINATRQIMLAAGGGIVLLVGAAFTARTFHLSRRGQFADRYTKAMALLASEKITERLGGIYALEHLMIESQTDHDTVIEVLAAFIREQTASPESSSEAWDAEHHHEGGKDRRPRVATDVQAALTVIGRRPQRSERNKIDLSVADLCGAELRGFSFDGVSLWRAKLRSALLQRIHLNDANLCWAQLQGARLTGANLRNTALSGAQLQGTMLMKAQLQSAELDGANLQGAHLQRLKLRGVVIYGGDSPVPAKNPSMSP